ncbi:Potassium efflux system KefA protein / Small-conductance mechanosensitive channel [Methylophaga frappieri]|uniref:Potassium efflux system KefA protein / Small-conductance mechanosensitive channel n=1 Tax=Methylophaga frappieri (strain ATCC BAA-2434 / DSM 25690 / JAM7) TaxID=754477 RepID=I1YEN1_METFJ|nr:mechanosensitive ion channel domain-containing protein [Methylophaga frappieri]AFJ01374.1 Potassium efflux system KefA protein / Small-conductance mechanosensitive channel [Methylophaga frappieri]
MDLNKITTFLSNAFDSALTLATSPSFYSQIGFIVLGFLAAQLVASFIRRHIPLLKEPPKSGALLNLRTSIHNSRDLLLPLMMILFLSVTADISQSVLGKAGLVTIAMSWAVIFMLYKLIDRLVQKILFKKLAYYVLLPIAILHVFGWLPPVITYLEGISITLGNIELSAYGVVRVLIFGSILFWLGRLSNHAGQQIIRSQEDLDIGTREVFAKLFQIVLFFVLFLLLLQIMGINLTALAVFGGALGVGLGFGLQSIASNFISGIILLLERSLSVGDYVEMEDGRKGTIRELNMRSTTLETYDGKDIMVPNEQFITTSFTNWTHKNFKQRYALNFQVAYKTDLHFLFDLIREVAARHPRIISGDEVPIEERPDAEISGFGDSGVDILVEFWMEGIDDGENRVGADLLLMLWDAFHEHNIEIPFPQREVKILNQK